MGILALLYYNYCKEPYVGALIIRMGIMDSFILHVVALRTRMGILGSFILQLVCKEPPKILFVFLKAPSY